jgi:hypothetical protein
MIRRLEQVIKTLLYGSWILIWHISHALVCCIFFSYQSTSIFLLQDNLIKDKAANSNNSVLAAQPSPPEDDDDEAQADGPSQDGAPGDNLAKFFL